MATYYVRKTGSDANSAAQAQDPATAWLTIDKAANNVAAGDTVYVGAGTYRESVTMDTSGSSGNQISFIADVDGSQTGDPGLVVISAFTDSNTASRTFCWDPDGKIFVTVRGFVMQGGTLAVVYSPNTTDDNYEGVIFEDCVFDAGPDNADRGWLIDFNAASTPTNNGLTVRRCIVLGGVHGLYFQWNGNASADQDLKITIENSVLWNNQEAFDWDLISSNTFASGGVSINNCLIVGGSGVSVDNGSSTTYPVDVRNCLIQSVNTALNKLTSNDGALTSDYNTIIGGVSNVTAGGNDRTETSSFLLGGIHDFPLYRFLGWSPYKPFEPMRPNSDDDWTSLIGDASATFAPADDLYGNPRPMSQAGTTQRTFYFNDSTPSDPGASWTNDGNAFDGDFDSGSSTYASTTTQGSESADYLSGTGTTAPASNPSAGDILSVQYTWYKGADGANSSQGYFRLFDGGTGLSVHNTNNAIAYDPNGPFTCTPPSGGWTWAKINGLEGRFWKGDADSDELRIYGAKILVTYESGNADDRGAVEGRARPEQETTTVRTGSNALRFEGAGYHDILVPVAANSTTITVYARKDSNYTGTAPQLKVLNIPGVADKTDTHTAAANTWEQLTSGAFTPTSAGVCRVRLISNDTSATGQSFFDDLELA